MKIVAVLLLPIFLYACGYNKNESSYFLKNSIDDVTEVHQKQSLTQIKNLMHKLYLRNPNELKKNIHDLKTISSIIFTDPKNLKNNTLTNNTRSLDSIYLAFKDEYKGDRVFALIYGMVSMLLDVYNNKTSFIITDVLHPQKFYNSARNFEVINWKLNNNKAQNGKLFLLSNSTDEEKGINLSFERLFGKLISQQDIMAKVLRDSTGRSFRDVVVNIASGLLLPV